MKGKTTLNETGGNGFLRDYAQRGILLLLVLMIGVFVLVPGVCAYHNTGDLIDDFVYYSSACPGYGNAVWVDTDGIVNGATYGEYETMVVFETVSGEGYPDSFGSYPDFYFFTADKTNCGGGALDRGRIVIYFVDMLAAGFNQNQPATWTFKSVPKIYISASHDATVASGVPYGSAYQQIKAYRNRGQSGLVTGVVEPDPGFGSYRDYYFYDAAGIRELYVTTDFAENTLNSFQIETGAQPNTVTVIAPNGGESWQQGTTHTIQWTRTGTMSDNYFNIELLKGGTVNKFLASVTLDAANPTQSYSWTVPPAQTPGSDYQIRVTNTGSLPYSDTSNAYFSITSTSVKTITVTSPNGGEIWKANTPHSVTWTQTGLSGTNVKIDLFKDRVFYRSIVPSIAATAGTYAWTVPEDVPVGSTYEVWITTLSEPILSDWTDGWLSIAAAPTIRVITPDGDQTWNPGTAQTITWTQTGLIRTNVKILLMKDYGFNVAKVIAPSVPATSGSYTWTVPSTLIAGSDYWVKIVSLSYPAVQGDMWSGWITIPGVTLKPLPGYAVLPTDPDHDGIYEDLNGNGRLDFADVVLYFNQITWIEANEPIAAFDLNGNGRIDFADIVALFNEI
jgi:PKD repeat protein